MKQVLPGCIAHSRPVLVALLTFPLLAAMPVQAAWYQVEVIVFENVNPDADGESWDENPGLPDRWNAIDLVIGPGDAAPPATESNLIPYLALESSWFRLDGVFRALRLSREYRPLLHVAWQQPGEGPAAERAVHLQLQRTPAAGATAGADLYVAPETVVDGIVQLRIGRFLHVAVDMAYFPRPAQPAGEAAATGAAAEYLRMRGRRKILLNDLNYFDHPLFGMLVQVSRLRAPESEKRAEGGS
jgi:hypothetical protein